MAPVQRQPSCAALCEWAGWGRWQEMARWWQLAGEGALPAVMVMVTTLCYGLWRATQFPFPVAACRTARRSAGNKRQMQQPRSTNSTHPRLRTLPSPHTSPYRVLPAICRANKPLTLCRISSLRSQCPPPRIHSAATATLWHFLYCCCVALFLALSLPLQLLLLFCGCCCCCCL